MKNGVTTLVLMAASLCGLGVLAGSEIPESPPSQNIVDCVLALQEPQSNRDRECCFKERKWRRTEEQRRPVEEIRRIKLAKEEEKEKVDEQFAKLVESGVLHQLNWTNAIQRL